LIALECIIVRWMRSAHAAVEQKHNTGQPARGGPAAS
jgi:hypothetical protein